MFQAMKNWAVCPECGRAMALDMDEIPVRYLVCINPECNFGEVAELAQPLTPWHLAMRETGAGGVIRRMRDGNLAIRLNDAMCMCHAHELIVDLSGKPLYSVLPKHVGAEVDCYQWPYDPVVYGGLLERAREVVAEAGLAWPAL